MTQPAVYARRLAQLSSVLRILASHPQGMRLADLGAELGLDAESLRETILAFYRLDLVAHDPSWFHHSVVEFVGAGGDPGDPHSSEWVRVLSARPERELGVEYLSAAELTTLYAAARQLAVLEPDNTILREALTVLTGLLEPLDADGRAPDEREPVPALATAVQQRRRVRIVYARAWNPGVAERVVEPYRMVQTRRGWEVDAGPPDDAGALRTFLVSGIRELELLGEDFTPPADLERLLDAARQVLPVDLVVPQSARWAVERFAEHVDVVQEDEGSVRLRAAFLPPVEQRVGLVLITAGPEAFAMEPARLRDAARDLARGLLEHHGRPQTAEHQEQP